MTYSLFQDIHVNLPILIIGVPTPSLLYVDQIKNSIYIEYLDDCVTLKEWIDRLLSNKDEPSLDEAAKALGEVVAKLHLNGIIHGDLTTSNFLVRAGQMNEFQLIVIDFGLTTIESANNPEDKGNLYSIV